MTRDDRDSVFQHLDGLDRLLGDWERYTARFSLSDITRDRDSFHLSCHAMLQAIQQALDIAGDLVVSLDIRPRPTTYREVFTFLGRHEGWPPALVDRLAELAGFRNVLSHQYHKLKLKEVHRHLRLSSKPLRRFQLFVVEKLRPQV